MHRPLRIIIGNVRLTGMQTAALVARLGSKDHQEAAGKIYLNYSSFRWRHAKAISRLPADARNRYYEALPRHQPKPKPVQTRSLISNFGDA